MDVTPLCYMGATMNEAILKETHALKSGLNGMLLLLDPKVGLSEHSDENVRKNMNTLRSCMGYIIMRLRNIESQLGEKDLTEFDEYFTKFGIPKPKEY